MRRKQYCGRNGRCATERVIRQSAAAYPIFLAVTPLHEMKSEIRPFLRKIRRGAKSATAAPQERGRQKAAQDAKAAYRRNLAEKRTAERHIVPPPSDRGGTMTTPQKGNQGASVKGSPAPKSGQAMTKATRTMRVRPTDHAAPNNAIITRRARAAAQRKAQRTMLQDPRRTAAMLQKS